LVVVGPTGLTTTNNTVYKLLMMGWRMPETC